MAFLPELRSCQREYNDQNAGNDDKIKFSKTTPTQLRDVIKFITSFIKMSRYLTNIYTKIPYVTNNDDSSPRGSTSLLSKCKHCPLLVAQRKTLTFFFHIYRTPVPIYLLSLYVIVTGFLKNRFIQQIIIEATLVD